MRSLGILLGITLLTAGCTVIEEKKEDYEAAVSCYGRPDKVVICWSRDGEERKGFEARCCGKDCSVPQCSDHHESGE